MRAPRQPGRGRTRSAVGSGTRRPAAFRGKRVFSGQKPVRDRNLPPASHTELLPQHVRVGLGSPGRDPETHSHLFVRATGCDQRDDLSLTLCDRRRLLLVDSSIMAVTVLPRSRDDHCARGVTEDVFRWWSSDYVIGTWRRTFGATRSRISDRLSPVHVRPWFRRPITACAGSGSSATRSATAIASSCVPHG